MLFLNLGDGRTSELHLILKEIWLMKGEKELEGGNTEEVFGSPHKSAETYKSFANEKWHFMF